MHQAKVAPDDVGLVGIDDHCATLSPKVSKRREDVLQDERPTSQERPSEGILESRNLEKVMKKGDCILQDEDREGVIDHNKKEKSFARKSVQFCDDC